MRLSRDEQAMLDGQRGPARQKAMELLIRYGEALGAERMIDTNNVCAGVAWESPAVRGFAVNARNIDAVFSEFHLDSSEQVEIPKVEVYSCHINQAVDPIHWKVQGVEPELLEVSMRHELFFARIGVQLLNTCAPYLVGNVPVKGEHCAWMESSAVSICNSVFGGRTNTEGCESTGAAMLTGKIPYWGYHLDENRKGTHLVEVEFDLKSIMDWGLLGYHVGEVVQDRVPVFNGVRQTPNLPRLKHLAATAASSGGVEMFHIVGVTPEARTLDEAFAGEKPAMNLKFGLAERQEAYAKLNSSAKHDDVDFAVLGCPHYGIEDVWDVCRLLEGKKVHCDTSLWIFVPRAIKDIADRSGYSEIIRNAGAFLMIDNCPAAGEVKPKGARIAATDSAKQAHYLPALMNLPTWFGSREECIQAAISGKWEGELK